MSRRSLRWLTARPIAHRGLHDIAAGRPENSLAAFAAAVAGGYAIECDVHISKDGVPVIFHDDDLYRLTGEAGPLRDRTAAELTRLRLAGTAETMPTLDELMALTRGRVPLVIELKHVAGRDGGLAETASERARTYDGPAALMSFEPALIAGVREAAPLLPRGLTALGDGRAGLDVMRAILELGVDFVSYAIDDLPTPAPVIANKVLGIPLICWTVRNPEQLRKARTWTDQITFEGFTP